MQRYFEINKEGHNVRCKIYFNDLKTISKVIIYGHGFGGHKDNKAAEKFAERILTKYKGIAVICFDLPCHGDDVKKKLQLQDCDTYIRLVIEYAKEQFDTDIIYMYATSFGGYLTLKYIADNGNPFKKVALRCPAINMYNIMVKSVMKTLDFDKLEKGKEALVGFDRKISIGKPFLDELQAADVSKREFLDYADDIIIIHGNKDEIVPCENSAEFAEENVIEMITVENADHRFQDPKTMEAATKAILEFWDL